MYSRVYRRDRVARSAASWICCPSWVWLSSSTEAACASGYKSVRACTNVFLPMDSSDRSSLCDHCSRRSWYVCAPVASSPHRDGVAGGGEKILGSNPSLGVAIGDEKRVNMGEWSVPSGPGVLPIADIILPTPPAVPRAVLLAYTASIRDFLPLELDHV